MKFRIMAEAHEGVFSCDEECIDVVEAENSLDALQKCTKIHFDSNWNCFLLGNELSSSVRKCFAVNAQ